MTYRPTPLAEVWKHTVHGQMSVHVAIGDFLDDWRRVDDSQGRAALIETPIDDADDPDLHRWSAFAAAMVEYLCRRDGVPIPEWVWDERWILPEPWFLNPYWKLRAWMLAVTPAPWKRRRIFGGDEATLIGRV